MRSGITESRGKLTSFDALHSLRVRVLCGALNLLAITMLALDVFVVVSEVRSGGLTDITLGISIFILLFPALRFASPRLGYRKSAFALIALLLATAFIVESRGGVSVGSVSVNVLVLILSALFFGRRGAAIALAAVLALFSLAAYLVLSGAVPPIIRGMWDPERGNFWLREVFAFALFGVAFVVTEVFIVERLAREADRLQAQLEREHQQRLELERLERDREHEREQRLEAQKALEESRRMEALARLAGGIAHDFNNSLTVIMGTAEYLRESAASPAAVRAGADEIIEAAKRTGEFTRQLLTLGRRQMSQPQAVPMAQMFARVSAALRRILPGDVALKVEEPADGLTAHADPNELERALFNLAINARDAMPRGGELTIRCRRETREGAGPEPAPAHFVEVTVSDTGEGMDPETIERIFDPFFTTKSPGAGTGLGLATVYAFANASGGEVRVESARGAGSTFHLLLPEGVSHADRSAQSALAPGAAKERPRVPVLLAEDRADLRASFARILTRAGYEVREAVDGDDALAQLQQRRDFALMCIDGVMPGTATGTVIDRARELAPSMRVLLCSGHLEEDLLRRGVAAGRYAFLQKPFSSEELLRNVRALLHPPVADGSPPIADLSAWDRP